MFIKAAASVITTIVSLTVATSAFAADPVPGQAAASAPSAHAIPITATCSLGDHDGIDDVEAKTGADIICHDLAKRGATNTNHEVRFGKLGGKTVVTLAARQGNSYNEARTLIQGMDELDVAGPRLVTSLVDNKSMNDTRTVDNVLANEQRAPKLSNQGAVMCELGMFGASSVGESSTASAGFDVGLGYRAGNFGIQGDGRLGGIGSGDNKMSSASLDVGAKIYLSDGDFAPFVGGGFEMSYFKLNRTGGGDLSASGVGSFGTIGVEALRSHHMGLIVAGRIDLPFYSLEGTQTQYTSDANSYYGSQSSTSSKTASYVMPISLTVGLVFH